MVIPENDSTGTEVPLVSTRQPHQQRVVEEKEALDDKITKLTAFIGGTIFAALDDYERSRLSIQLQHMNGYSEILGQRIAAFPASTLTIVP